MESVSLSKNILILSNWWLQLPTVVRSGILMLMATGVLAGMHTVIRYLSAGMHPFQIAFFRSLFGLLFLLPLLMRHGITTMKTRQLRLNLVRAVTSVCAMLGYFYGISVIELAKATTLSFTNAIFGSLAAVLFLGEKMHPRRWVAVLLGFVGVLVVLRPGVIEVNLGSIAVLFSAVMWGISIVLMKQLTRTDSTVGIIIWFTVSTTVLTFPFALWYWTWPSWNDLFWLTVMGLLGSLGHLGAVSGFKLSDATAVLPMDFTRLIWVSLFGFLLFGEIPEIWTWMGAAIIISSTGVIIFSETKSSLKPEELKQ